MNAVIYARYSSDNQREESIEGQLRECMEFANHTGVTVVGNYIDRAFSAKTDNRPEFQKMIKDSYKHCFDMIIVWKLDRFARNRYDSAHYKNLFGRLTPPKGFDFLAQGAVSLALGHRSRETYALTHLAPKKRYQRFS